MKVAWNVGTVAIKGYFQLTGKSGMECRNSGHQRLCCLCAGVCQHDPDDAASAVLSDGVCGGAARRNDRDEGRRGAGLLVCHSERRGGGHTARRFSGTPADGGQVGLVGGGGTYRVFAV